MIDNRLGLAVFAWLLVCAVQDWRWRRVSNWLTLPPVGMAIWLRLTGIVRESLLPVCVAAVLLFLAWVWGRIGGADAKASLALALMGIQYLAWAWLGLGAWYLGLRLVYGRKCERRLPAFVGFTSGVGALLVIGWL